MKCYNCGDEFVLFTGSLELPSNVLGSYTIDNAKYFKCVNCGEIFLSDESWCSADKKESQLITEFIGNLAFNKFIGASKAASILGMSRQAFHKHKRIKRGFIYSITLERHKYYHIESVKLFKNTGDGRFQLYQSTTTTTRPYENDSTEAMQNAPFVVLNDQEGSNGFFSDTGSKPVQIIVQKSYAKQTQYNTIEGNYEETNR